MLKARLKADDGGEEGLEGVPAEFENKESFWFAWLTRVLGKNAGRRDSM